MDRVGCALCDVQQPVLAEEPVHLRQALAVLPRGQLRELVHQDIFGSAHRDAVLPKDLLQIIRGGPSRRVAPHGEGLHIRWRHLRVCGVSFLPLAVVVQPRKIRLGRTLLNHLLQALDVRLEAQPSPVRAPL